MIRKKKKKPNPLKPSTRSRVSKGPARDEKHLARVRRARCLWCEVPSEIRQAHHVRCISYRTMGVRVSDYLAVPLCDYCHRFLHSGDEETFWKMIGVDPAAWIASFSPEGRAAIQELKINKQE